MRRLSLVLALLLAATTTASAQMPPSIQKPIDAARKAAGRTDAQTRAVEKVGEEKKELPAAAAQASPKAGPQGTKGAAAPTKAATAAPAPAPAAADSAERRGSASQAGSRGTTTFYREEFTYVDENRRDPFVSLMSTGELRPLLADLVLTGVLYDRAAPNRSLAVVVDGTTKETYRVKVGMILGRMKVAKIGENSVTLSIDEFGFSRQETLLLGTTPTTKTAGEAPARRPL